MHFENFFFNFQLDYWSTVSTIVWKTLGIFCFYFKNVLFLLLIIVMLNITLWISLFLEESFISLIKDGLKSNNRKFGSPKLVLFCRHILHSLRFFNTQCLREIFKTKIFVARNSHFQILVWADLKNPGNINQIYFRDFIHSHSMHLLKIKYKRLFKSPLSRFLRLEPNCKDYLTGFFNILSRFSSISVFRFQNVHKPAFLGDSFD